MNDERDNFLVQRCIAGDTQCYAELVHRYQTVVYNTALRMTGDADDAREVSQAAFVKAFEHLGQFDPQYRFFSWLYRICVNETLNFLKFRHRNERLDAVAVTEAPGNEPGSAADKHALQREIQQALLELSDDSRIVILLRHYRDLSYQEIADMIGIQEKTVKSRLFSARQQLKNVLERRGIHP